jgi:drug/metabolite transporter (DMT)-like permease
VSGKTIFLTTAALIAFAGNSLLCRLALAERHIDAASFTGIRLVSGAAVLLLLAARRPPASAGRASFGSALALFLYAAPFSYAYLRLPAGVGALVLFAVVQATMVGWGIIRGERPRPLVWIGLALAIGGLLGLTLRGVGAPDPVGIVGMAAAGVAWGVYSLRGRSTTGDPVVATAANFARAAPLALLLVAVAARFHGLSLSLRGASLAVASGALASGLGYSIWYAALRDLTATRAAVLQLLVPVLAAAGGVVLLGEALTWRLVLAGGAILGGVGLAIRGRS